MIDSPALKIDDLKEMAEPFLTEKTKAAMAVNERVLTVYRANSEGGAFAYAKCLYLGKRVALSKVEDGVKAVAEKVNLLGEAGEITSSLSHFVKFDLYNNSISKESECIVLCYVHVTVPVYDRVMADMKTYGAFSDGEIPE